MEHTLKDVARLFKQGMSIVIVHGGGPMLSKKMKEKNIPVRFEQGLRVTTRETMEILIEVFSELNRKICEVLEMFFCPTQSIIADPCIKANLIDPQNTENRVGKIKSINIDKFDLTRIPVTSSIAVLEKQ